MTARNVLMRYGSALLVLLFVLAGCGDDDNDQTGINNAAMVDAGQQDTYNPCGQGQSYCDETCIDTTSDPNNCGGCGVTCPSWNSQCIDSRCVCDNESYSYCNGFCIDTQYDPQNCGGCGIVCEEGSSCDKGECLTGLEQATKIAKEVLNETNKARSTSTNCGEHGTFPPAEPLAYNRYLQQAAQAHSEDMAANNFHAHEGSDGSDFVTRVERTDFQGNPVGENVAMGYKTAKEVVDGWVSSPGHCKNIMNPDATLLGVGYATDENAEGETRWTQVFGN